MLVLIKRFIRAFIFYVRRVGLKNVLTVELPEFIYEAREHGTPGYSLFENLVDIMEDGEDDYLG